MLYEATPIDAVVERLDSTLEAMTIAFERDSEYCEAVAREARQWRQMSERLTWFIGVALIFAVAVLALRAVKI